MRVIVDLTEFNTWSGHLTGVQRVVNGLATEFGSEVDDEPETLFITFDARHKVFRQVSFQRYREMTKPVTQASLTTQSIPAGMSAKHRLKGIAKKVYYKAPIQIQNKFTPERKANLKKVVNQTIAKARAIKTRARNSALLSEGAEEFKFREKDVVLVAGRAWDHGDSMASLETAKANKGIRLAYVVYDLIPIYQQHTFGPGLTERYSQYLFRILKKADYLFPISDSSHRDTLKYADEVGITRLPVIKTIRLGDDIPGAEVANTPSFVKNPTSFAMTVGTIEARKNHTQIYYAYKLAASKGIELPDMYVVGKPGWLTGDVIYFIQNDIEVKDKITILYNVSDEELTWMYERALFTVFPSQYEGWGLPIAESLAFGTPCIASNTSSMIEIAPKYVDHISPFDTSELMERMLHYTKRENSEERRKEITKAYRPQQWSGTANTMLKVISG